MLREIIDNAKANPFLAFAWTVFTLCLGCVLTLELAFPDTADYFEKANIEITVVGAERDRAVKLLEVYRETFQKITDSSRNTNSYIDSKFPNITVADTLRVRTDLVNERRELSKILALLRNAHFENKLFSDLFHDLEQDAVYTDEFIAKRIEFVDLMLTNFEQAREMRPSMEMGLVEERKALEISAREPAIEYALERTRQEFNAKLRTAQRKEKLYKMQSKVKIGAMVYVGAFIGGWGGFFVRRWRKRKHASSGNDRSAA